MPRNGLCRLKPTLCSVPIEHVEANVSRLVRHVFGRSAGPSHLGSGRLTAGGAVGGEAGGEGCGGRLPRRAGDRVDAVPSGPSRFGARAERSLASWGHPGRRTCRDSLVSGWVTTATPS